MEFLDDETFVYNVFFFFYLRSFFRAPDRKDPDDKDKYEFEIV